MFHRATSKKAKLRLALCAPAGAGKDIGGSVKAAAVTASQSKELNTAVRSRKKELEQTASTLSERPCMYLQAQYSSWSKEERLKSVSQSIGREISSFKNLTSNEASSLIDIFERENIAETHGAGAQQGVQQ